jgi:serine/threonine protein kinase
MFNLSGIYIRDDGFKIIENINWYAFSILLPNNTRTYLCPTKEECKDWILTLRKVTGYEDLNEIFEIKEKVGEGKYGIVKRCIQKTTNREAAIKIVKKILMDQESMNQLNIEIEILKMCQHPNIIKLYDIFENQEYLFISNCFLILVTEYCKGGDLYKYLEKRKFNLSEARASEISLQLATALYYIQSYSIVHRDIKPENILLSDDSDNAEVKLLDFGLSKMMIGSNNLNGIVGTLVYIAPEVLLDRPYDEKVDIWSYGILCYCLITGCIP